MIIQSSFKKNFYVYTVLGSRSLFHYSNFLWKKSYSFLADSKVQIGHLWKKEMTFGLFSVEVLTCPVQTILSGDLYHQFLKPKIIYLHFTERNILQLFIHFMLKVPCGTIHSKLQASGLIQTTMSINGEQLLCIFFV